MGGARQAAVVVVVAVAAALVAVAPGEGPAAAQVQAQAPGAGVAHPRVLYTPGDEGELQDRLTREPYRTVFLQAHARAQGWNRRALGDMSINAQRDLSRAAKVLALSYALDRTVVGGQIVPFADPAARAAVGDRVRALLLNLYPRSRLAVAPPLGGWDRDISTSEEIVNYAVALDTLLGAGYDLGDDRAVIVERLAAVTGELHANFVDPSTAGDYTLLHQNNHRTKSGASMAIAAVVLADDVPEARAWFDDGVLLVDDGLRHVLVTGDGAYAESPHYYRLTMQNLAALLSAWDRVLGDDAWTAGGIEVPDPAAHPLFRRTQRWMLDVTMPDGSMAPLDDGNVRRSYYFGVLPSTLPEAAAGYWRWANAPQPYDTDGSVELAPETIVAYDDTITPRQPWWAPTQFYVEGGTASLRSDWSDGAVMALVLGEHDTASEFGRDRLGVGRAPQSHEHADGGSFSLHAFGEPLALDPGYLTFATHGLVNRPEHHNMVLVDGAGPADYLSASFAWLQDPLGRPPAEGQATLHGMLDAGGMDAVGVATWYRDTTIDRRFLLADDRYLVVADTVDGSGGSLSWMQHGNGGGTSGGTFEATPAGGRWQIGGGRLDTGLAVAGATPELTTSEAVHEAPGNQQRTHTALEGTVAGGSADAVQVLYPSAAGAPAPTVTALAAEPDAAAIEVLDAAGDRRVVVRNGPADRDLSVVDEHLDGSLRLAYAEGVSTLAHGGATLVGSRLPGTLGIRLGAGTADLVARTPDPVVTVSGIGFTPAAADGACAVTTEHGVTTLRLGRDRRVTLRADGGGSRPAADPGRDRRVPVGTTVVLDASRSCDADGSALTPRWELVSAPAGSAWSFTGTDTMHPTLVADRPGPYRARLVVTDPSGAESLEEEVVVVAGDRCGDGVDDDLDGRIDTDDPDCDGAEPPSGVIAGTVTGPGGAPAAGVEVLAVAPTAPWFDTHVAVTGADGRYALEGLPDGPQQVYFRAPAAAGLVDEWWGDARSRSSAATVAVSADSPAEGVDAELAPAGAVVGAVRGPGGEPVAGAQVWAYAAGDTWLGSHVAVTAPDGSYVLGGIVPGEVDLYVVPPAGSALLPQWWDGRPSRGAADPIVVPAGAATGPFDVELAPAAAVVGVVRGPGGEPVAGAQVWAYAPGDGWVGSAAGVSGEDGTFEIAGLAGGTYRLLCRPPAASGLGPRWYDGAPSRAEATPVEAVAGSTTGPLTCPVG